MKNLFALLLSLVATYCSHIYAQQAIPQDSSAIAACINSKMEGKKYAVARETAYNSCGGEVQNWMYYCQRKYSPNGYDDTAARKCDFEFRDLTSAIDAQREKRRIESGDLTPQELQQRQNAADREALRAGKPNTETVTAQGVGPFVPGAIICPDYRTVGFVIELYKEQFTDQLQDRLYGQGQSQLLRGPSAKEPNYRRYGCELVQAGSPMTLERGNVVPVVRAKLQNGSTVRGVTDPSMIRR